MERLNCHNPNRANPLVRCDTKRLCINYPTPPPQSLARIDKTTSLINCQNPNPTSTQPNLTEVWVLHENDWAHHHHPPKTQCRQYLSCYLHNFDQALKIGSWNDLEQILTVTVTFVQAIFVLATFVHIRNISAVTDPILTKL